MIRPFFTPAETSRLIRFSLTQNTKNLRIARRKFRWIVGVACLLMKPCTCSCANSRNGRSPRPSRQRSSRSPILLAHVFRHRAVIVAQIITHQRGVEAALLRAARADHRPVAPGARLIGRHELR